jgi:putative phosphoribosyl transferase
MFRNREHAGRLLGRELRTWELHDPVVLGIPRGGVAVAAALASEIQAEMDVLLSRKLRAPDQPELAIGAIDEHGRVMLLPYADALCEAEAGYLEHEIAFQEAEIERRRRMYRAIRGPASLADRSVVVTDDGIATGSTMEAALRSLGRTPREIILAVPVATIEALQRLARHCDDSLCLHTPPRFRTVGEYYEEFDQVDDEEACRLLRQAASVSASPLQETSHGTHSP